MKRSIGLLIGALALLTATQSFAQDTNLLHQGDFDTGYSGRGRPDLNIPGGWGIWLADTPRTEDWMNRPDKVFAFPHTAPPEVHRGAASIDLSGGYVTYTAALYQQARAPIGIPVEASAWAWLHTCNFPRNNQNEITSGICDSSPASGALVKIGIDPNGGIDPTDADVVWSDATYPHDRWEQLAVSARPTGPVVTVFLYTTQSRPSDLNDVYWDDAVLTTVDSQPTIHLAPLDMTIREPGALPMPQTAQDDGSIIHLVQPGDTLDGIAMVYGVSRAQLLGLNPMTDPRALRVGQPILVRQAG